MMNWLLIFRQFCILKKMKKFIVSIKFAFRITHLFRAKHGFMANVLATELPVVVST